MCSASYPVCSANLCRMVFHLSYYLFFGQPNVAACLIHVFRYLKTRPGQRTGEHVPDGRSHENEGGDSGKHRDRSYNEMFGGVHFHPGNEEKARARPHEAEEIKKEM